MTRGRGTKVTFKAFHLIFSLKKWYCLFVCLFVCFQGFSLRNSAKATAIIHAKLTRHYWSFTNVMSIWKHHYGVPFFGRYNIYSWILVFYGWDGARTHNLLRYPDRESDAGLRNLRYPGIGVPRKKSESQKKNQHMKFVFRVFWTFGQC